ncbi:hypothetical protein BOX15_Mlig015024g1 [Macrostomum lignano]|uniref:Uncharacterized protein n=2 Tax=Macrostomum lignano TaxID=282301 RepID=A0A267DLV0_9PLAT|nr:hypothetical protein BOX15_Mlig001286g3 [Macrostomum lignano]PAA59413.1 hypothetical protein BOX15_Mlig001286g1 [Macrostomum lignano]PAA59423.1 hypothetical protein BOX15_Mlig015024g1 [Macrostomum lignano]
MEADEQFDFLFKIVLVGDAGVGKSCVVQRFKSGNFLEKQGSTIGVDFTMKTLLMDGCRIKLQVWDTAGQERFRTITQSYYRSANAVILAYDITKRESFDSLPRWVDDVGRYAGTGIVQLLVGCKQDLKHLREVRQEEAAELANRLGMLASLETSAKENSNIDRVFNSLAAELKRRHGGDTLGGGRSGDAAIRLNSRSLGGRACC